MTGWHTKSWRCRAHAIISYPINVLGRLADKVDPPLRHKMPPETATVVRISQSYRLTVHDDGTVSVIPRDPGKAVTKA